MNVIHLSVAFLALAASAGPRERARQADPCGDLVGALSAVPHVSLDRRDGLLKSTWDEHPFQGCQIDFETNDSTLSGASAPDFWADDPASDMYRAGWRMVPEILADGPGSGIYAIRRDATRCVVQWAQPAYLDDDGNIVQSDTFTMVVQCEVAPSP